MLLSKSLLRNNWVLDFYLRNNGTSGGISAETT